MTATFHTPSKLISILKERDEDHEFYPTTNEIIAALTKDLALQRRQTGDGIFRRYRDVPCSSVLDIGAGNGKVLRALRAADIGIQELYAIEKSALLRQQLGADVFVVGTEFEQQSLLFKQVDVIFCNPPYSEFATWTTKIIRESPAPLVYLVIPRRWEQNDDIAGAIKFRAGKTKIIGEFDFEDAEDRAARAKVHLLRITLSTEKDDAFERFFDEQFGGLKARFSAPKSKDEKKADASFGKLVVGENYPTAMVELYNAEMSRIQRNYEKVAELDVELLAELDIIPSKIMASLKQRLEGLRSVYWQEIFNRTSAITDRLTTKNRRLMLESLNRRSHVDFTVDNIYAVILWVIKNANQYLDSQLVAVFDEMVDKANVTLYKSNQRPFTHDRWRYQHGEGERPTHFALEYRIVLHHLGGMQNFYGLTPRLNDRNAEFLGDLLTVARNLGFHNDTADHRLSGGYGGPQEWQSGMAQEFEYRKVREVGDRVPKIGKVAEKVWLTDAKTWQYRIDDQWYHEKVLPGDTLLEVKAFKNGNCHIRMYQRLALALNVEYGRLKGWLKSGAEAAEELNDPKAAELFATSQFQLPTGGNSMLLLAD